MASSNDHDRSSDQKRTIEFDMFVRDLEPNEEKKIRGGAKTGEPQTPEDRKVKPQH